MIAELKHAVQSVIHRVWYRTADVPGYMLLTRMLATRAPGAARPESIHFAVASLALGGAQQQLVSLVRELVSRGYRCKVWLLVPGDSLFSRPLADAGGESQDIWHGAGAAGAVLFNVWRACAWRSHVIVAVTLGLALRRDRPTVLQSLLDTTNVAGALAGRLARVPVVVAGLRSLHPRDRMGTYVEAFHRECYDLLTPALVDAVIVNSQAGAASFERHHPGALARKLTVVPNGVRTSAPGAAPDSRLWRELGLHPEIPLVAWVGRLSAEKRLDVFLRACRALSDVEFHAVVVGDGHERAPLHRLCRELGLDGRVSFLGVRIDARDIMSAAYVVVLSSDFEGFPNALLEAQAMGRPVVATRAGGTIELVEDGVTGLLVEPGDADAMADRLRQLLRDPKAARRMGDAGAARVHACYTTSQLADRTLEVYRRAAADKGFALRPRAS